MRRCNASLRRSARGRLRRHVAAALKGVTVNSFDLATPRLLGANSGRSCCWTGCEMRNGSHKRRSPRPSARREGERTRCAAASPRRSCPGAPPTSSVSSFPARCRPVFSQRVSPPNADRCRQSTGGLATFISPATPWRRTSPLRVRSSRLPNFTRRRSAALWRLDPRVAQRDGRDRRACRSAQVDGWLDAATLELTKGDLAKSPWRSPHPAPAPDRRLQFGNRLGHGQRR